MEPQSQTLDSLRDLMRTFRADRGWDRFHNPKNVAMALAGEAGELVAEFQWLTAEQSERPGLPEGKFEAIESEMADIVIYLVQLADRLEVDLLDAAARKMEQNATRFPAGPGVERGLAPD